MKPGTVVTIEASDHPHVGEKAVLTSKTLDDTGQVVAELMDCAHGTASCGVSLNEVVIQTEDNYQKQGDNRFGKPKNKIGAPTKYTAELADKICEQIACGKSLRTICKSDEFPAMSQIFEWRRKHPSFQEQYARAKDDAADALADEIQDLANRLIKPVGECGPEDMIDAQRARVGMDALKWTASKLKPRAYGDKLDLTTAGEKLPTPLLQGLTQEQGK